MFEKIFPTPAIVALPVIFVIGFLLGIITGAVRRDKPKKVLLRGLEAGLCGTIGAVLARIAFGLPLWNGKGVSPPGASLVMLWAAVPILGLIETFAYLASKTLMAAPDTLLWIVTAIAAFTGAANGAGRIYNWKGAGIPAFLLDVTWGLSGSGLGGLLHFINLIIGTYSTDERTNSHRYTRGFQVKSGYVLTLGSVMSGMDSGSGGLYNHERLHTWQARLFGPFFPITYALWAVVFFIPALIAAGAKKVGAGAAIFTYCYLNNPWEVWAYQLGGSRSLGASVPLLWHGAVVIVWSILFYAAVGALTFLIVYKVWG